MSVWIKLGLAAGALYYLTRRSSCANRADYEPCGTRSKCLKGKCVEFVSCKDDPDCYVGTPGLREDVGGGSLWSLPATWVSAARELGESLASGLGGTDRTSDPDLITSPSDPRL